MFGQVDMTETSCSHILNIRSILQSGKMTCDCKVSCTKMGFYELRNVTK